MCRDLVGADSIGPHLLREEAEKGIFLSGIEALLIVIPEDHDAEVALILGAHMGTLPDERASGPNASAWIDGEVIANVAEGLRPASQVGAADGLQPLPGSRHRGVGKW